MPYRYIIERYCGYLTFPRADCGSNNRECLAIFTAILRASFLLSNLAADGLGVAMGRFLIVEGVFGLVFRRTFWESDS